MRHTNQHLSAQTSGKSFSASRAFFRRPVLLLCALLAALVLTGCFESKVVTTKVPNGPLPNPAKMNGVFYALPRTVVKVDVPVVRVDKKPGKYQKFAECFFPDVPPNQIIQQNATEFGIDSDNVRFDTLPVPDSKEIYLIKTQGGRFETRNLELALTESGVFVKGKAENTNNTIDIVTGAIKTGAGILSKFIAPPGLADAAEADFRDGLTGAQRMCFQKYEDVLTVALDQALMNAVITPGEAEVADPSGALTDSQKRERAKVLLRDALFSSAQTGEAARRRALILSRASKRTGDPLNVANARDMLDKALKDIGDFKDAKEVFDRIRLLEGQREQLLSPQPLAAPLPSDTLKMMLEELDKTIKNYKEAFFFGTKTPLTWNASFRLNPDNPGKMQIDLFTLSEQYGVCSVLVNQGASDQGVPFDPRFLIKKVCPPGTPVCKDDQKVAVACNGKKVWLEMDLGENGEGGAGGATFAQTVRTAGFSQDGKRGFYYRIPGRAIAKLLLQGDSPGEKDEMGRTALSIAQFGETVSLPSSTGGRKTKYDLELYTSSGGMKNFIMGSEALIQKSNIDDLGEAASTLIDARAERKKAQAPADELDVLERRRKILEERKKIKDLESELEPPANPAANP